jgi:hypothetical protein
VVVAVAMEYQRKQMAVMVEVGAAAAVEMRPHQQPEALETLRLLHHLKETMAVLDLLQVPLRAQVVVAVQAQSVVTALQILVLREAQGRLPQFLAHL